MKLYAITSRKYESYSILTLSDSKEKANEMLKELEELDEGNSYNVEEYDSNHIDLKCNLFVVSRTTSFGWRGFFVQVSKAPVAEYFGFKEPTERCCTDGKDWCVVIEAKNEEEAIEKALKLPLHERGEQR